MARDRGGEQCEVPSPETCEVAPGRSWEFSPGLSCGQQGLLDPSPASSQGVHQQQTETQSLALKPRHPKQHVELKAKGLCP